MAGRHHGVLRHLCAAILFGEPTRKLVAFERRLGRKCPVSVAVEHIYRFTRSYSAVRIEFHFVADPRPVRVERVFIRSCHHGFLRHLCAAILFGEPALKRIAFERRRGQFPIKVAIGHRRCLRRYRSAVRVEFHGVGVRRPVRVEHVVSRGCHHGFLRHLCAAIHFGEPARKRIAIARQRGQFPVGITVGHRPCLRRFCSAVRVESHGVFLCPLRDNVLDTGCVRRNFPDLVTSVLVLPTQEFISRFIQVFFRRKVKLSAKLIIAFRRVAIRPFAAVQIVIEFVIDFSGSGYVSLNRSIHIELRAFFDFQPAIFPNRDRFATRNCQGFPFEDRQVCRQRRIAENRVCSVLNKNTARFL